MGPSSQTPKTPTPKQTPKLTRDPSSATFHGWKDVDLGPSSSQTPKTPKLTRNPSSATFHGWKNVDLIVKRALVEEEEDDDDLNEGFYHYSLSYR